MSLEAAAPILHAGGSGYWSSDADLETTASPGSTLNDQAALSKPAKEKRLSGVGFMLKTSFASKLENLPLGHSDCIMSMRLPLENMKYVTLLSVYALTLQAEPAAKNNFYSKLRSLL